jgi:hypothetical protein
MSINYTATISINHTTTCLWRWNRQCSKMMAYKIYMPGITQKKAYNIQKTAKTGNQESLYRVYINYRRILQNLMKDASSVTKLFIPPSDRRLRRTTSSKLPSECALNHHKTVTLHKFQDTSTTLGRWGSHLQFPREMAVATVGPFQMLRSLCVIDMNFMI